MGMYCRCLTPESPTAHLCTLEKLVLGFQKVPKSTKLSQSNQKKIHQNTENKLLARCAGLRFVFTQKNSKSTLCKNQTLQL